MTKTLKQVFLLYCLTTLVAVTPTAATPATQGSVVVNNCDTAMTWFRKENAFRLTLSANRSGLQHNPKPKAPDSVDIYNFSFKEAAHYRGNVGGGGCLSGYYDTTNRIAAIISQYDTYSDNLLFFAKHPVTGFTQETLTSTHSYRGARLGMTLTQVVAIEGRGALDRLNDSQEILSYEWFVPMKGSNLPWTCDLTFLFENNRAVAIDYGNGV